MSQSQKELAFEKIKSLVERFEEQKAFYTKAEYNETQTRRDFIDPFFKTLGWDIDNENGYSEDYREVIHEDRLKIGKNLKAPDYAFRLVGGKRLFYVEAKKPSVSVKDDISPAYQVRRYGWSAKLAISIVTDFEEFAIYDCTNKPNINEKASVSRIKYINYKDYLTDFDFIWNTFSKEKVLKGSFDLFIKNDKFKKGTSTVDKEFLESLDNWRKILATNIALKNKLTEDELNYVVQNTIDRLIFLRIAEDRGIELYGTLQEAIKTGDYYANLIKLFHLADQKYNSGLFNFKKDTISESVIIENKIVKTIINDLYYPNSPYEFSVISIEILGSAYEQFLGKQIVLGKSGKVSIELKPEVRKAGGVYYTPEYIVNYIVENTLGKLLVDKTPLDVSKIKILDPACGSGSFLIGAYSYILNWHLNYFSKNPNKKNPLTPDGRLTTEIKKKILINNIYGVDIDSNAVEVTKLSLLLKCLEGETSESISSQMTLFKERALPTLENNIKSGNSLIDTTYYENEFDLGDEKKIKPFNWDKAFPSVFKEGKFDAVIGNPPYVFTRDVDWPDQVKDYYWKRFSLSKNNDKSRKNQSGKINLYILFIFKSTELIRKDGLVSFIIPNGLLRTTTYDTARKFLIEKTQIEEIVDLKDGVFDGVTASTIILSFTKKIDTIETPMLKIINANYKTDKFIDNTIYTETNQNSFLKNVSYAFSLYINEFEQSIFNKIDKNKFYLKDIIVDIIEGIVAHKEFISNKKNGDDYRPMLEGKDIKPFNINFNSNYILYDRKKLHRPRPEYLWDLNKKLVVQRISGGISPLVAAIDFDKYLAFASTNLIVIKKDFESKYSYELICGLLNSKLWNYYYSKNFSNSSKLTVNISKTFLEMLPLPFDIDEKISNKIIEYVNNLNQCTLQLRNSKFEDQSTQLQNKIDYLTDYLNNEIYKLYNLTSQESEAIDKYFEK